MTPQLKLISWLIVASAICGLLGSRTSNSIFERCMMLKHQVCTRKHCSCATALKASSSETDRAPGARAMSGPRVGTLNSVLCFISYVWQDSATNGPRTLTETTVLNPEADIFAFCDPSLLPKLQMDLSVQEDPEPWEANQPPKRPRPEPNPLFGTRSKHQQRPLQQAPFHPKGPRGGGHHPPPTMDPQVRMMAKLMLQHEEMLAAHRGDKVFIMFMRQDYASIIPNLFSISQQWHSKNKQQESVESSERQLQSPLRTVLMACLLKELLARIQKMASTTKGQGKLQAAGWMNDAGEWTFLRFCHKSRKLIRDQGRECMSHQEIVRQVSFLLEHMRGEIVQKFNSTQSLKSLEATAGVKPQATFILEISLRGEQANEMHQTLCTLIGSSMWQLVGISLKRGTLKRSPLADQLAQLVYGH